MLKWGAVYTLASITFGLLTYYLCTGFFGVVLASISLALEVVWLLGLWATSGVSKSLQYLDSKNLNNTSFHMLMLFCQLCMVLSVLVFCVAMSTTEKMSSLILELEYNAHEPTLRNRNLSDRISLATSKILTYTFSIAMIILLLRVSALLLSLGMQGLRWGDL